MPKARQNYSYVDEWKSRWEPELDAIAYNGATCDPTRVDPKVLDWVKHNCHDSNTPHFVKIINPNAANGKPGLLLKNSSSLTVPSPFVREHFRQLERVVTLENQAGRKWRVSFGAPKRDPQWLQGWDRVATDNNFVPGDVVVFVLVENSRFVFTHFDSEGNNLTVPNLKSPNSKSPNLTGPNSKNPNLGPKTGCSSQESHEAQSVRNDLGEPNYNGQSNKKKNLKRALDGPSCNGGPSSASPDDGLVGVIPQVQIILAPEIPAAAGSPGRKGRRLHFEEGNFGGNCNPAAGDGAIEACQKAQNSASVEELNRRGPVDGGNHVVVRKLFQQQQIDHALDPFGFVIKSKRKVTAVVEKERAKDAAMACARALPDQHHFVVVMGETQVYHDFHLVLPESFVTKSCLPTTSATRLILEDAGGTQWEMFIKKNKYDEVAFHRKFWALFALHHLLEEGDACVFQLKQSIKELAQAARTLVVHVFRVVPISASDISLHDHFALQKIRSATK